MSLLEIFNLVAILVAPLVAVIIGQILQDRALKRKEKLAVFKKLMVYRNIGYTEMTCVEALNQIPIIFIYNKKIMESYNVLIELLNDKNCPKNKIDTEKKRLLESMAQDLHYKKINWEIIENPYLPEEIIDNRSKGQDMLNNMSGLLSSVSSLTNEACFNGLKEKLIDFTKKKSKSIKKQKNKYET